MPIKPANLKDEHIQNYSNAYIFDVITNGVRSMPSHKEQIDVIDRWAIVSYVRGLQALENNNNNLLPSNLIDLLPNLLH